MQRGMESFMARRRIKYYTIDGTSLKYSQTMYNKIQKGTVNLENLAKSLAERNPLALQGLFENPKKEFMRIARQASSPESLLQQIKSEYRSALYQQDKGRLLAENMKSIVEQSMSNRELDEFKAKLNMKDINFDDWKWNESQKRLEGPDGGWVKVEGSSTEGYGSVNIEYGV